MPSRKHKIPPINSSASADIAFLLLTFFLVTSSFDPQAGIYGKMNPPVAKEALKKRIDIEERNILTFSLDANNRILYLNKEIPLKEIRSMSKTFIANPDNMDFLPEKENKEFPDIGTVAVTPKHVFWLKIDREAKYETYLSLLSELTAAYNELYRECAITFFHFPWEELNLEQKEIIQSIYPIRISEMETEAKEGGKK
ncbi:MAG: biopolymer transporter ExbD [Candidatus Azobacteroides sp.]|nr:biopolymer transporter ExbD [Candidatus Azobacteroides sp.]